MASHLVDNNIPHSQTKMDSDSGFPFDDDFDRDRTSFRTQLDDIAQRHPEFAQHLTFGGEFPFRGRRRSNERPQPHPEPEFPRRHERPFGSRFEEFGFPFSRHFDEPDFYQEEPPQQPPPQPSEKEVPREKEEKRQEEPAKVEQETPKPQENQEIRKQNIQQSNTVDLGKNQEPLDDQRGQRSMSAPPENRPAQQRFVSSINIPIQTQSGGGDMGARASQPESQKPNERVIPIHVEGRDEPVLPKNANFTPPPPQQQQQQPQQHHQPQQQQPQAERIFGRNPSHFTQFLNKGEPQMTPEEYYKQQQKNYQQQHQQNFQQQQQQQAQEAPQEQQAEQEAPKASKPGQIEQIQNIQKDVLELMNQVEKFEGKPRDKQYLYLDEMLTRNLIKLDNIETEGKENIRQARKEAIKCIEGCIGILEAKANENEARAKANQAIANVNEAEAVQEVQENKMEVEKVVAEEKVEEKKSEEPPAVKPEESTLEVSGVSRSGTVVSTDEATPMEVEAPAEEKKQEEEKKEETVDEPTQSGEAPQPVEDKPEEKKEKKKGKKKDKAEKK